MLFIFLVQFIYLKNNGLSDKVPTRTINDKALSNNISLTVADIIGHGYPVDLLNWGNYSTLNQEYTLNDSVLNYKIFFVIVGQNCNKEYSARFEYIPISDNNTNSTDFQLINMLSGSGEDNWQFIIIRFTTVNKVVKIISTKGNFTYGDIIRIIQGYK